MIGIAAVFGAVSIFAADLWVKSEASQRVETRTVEIPAPAQPKVEFKTIVVASEPLRFGMQLDRAQLTEIQWPQDALPQGAFPTIDALLAEGSRVVLSPMETNEPVLLAKLSGPNGRATLSNLLSPGMRAVTIKTDEIAGVGGFVTPGDRVDVVLTRDAGAIEEVSKNAEGAAGSTITTRDRRRERQGADGRAGRRRAPDQPAGRQFGDDRGDASTGPGRLRWRATSARCRCRCAPRATAARPTEGVTTISSFGGSVSRGCGRRRERCCSKRCRRSRKGRNSRR